MNRALVVSVFALGSALAAPGAAQTLPSDSACRGPHGLPQGSFSPDSTHQLLVVGNEGGRSAIRLVERATGRVTWRGEVDLQSYAWSPDGHWLVYAASPVYDAPGVFAVDARRGTTLRLVAARTRNAAYPQGADWMAICGVVMRPTGRYSVSYIRLPHVDSIDFAHFPAAVPRHTVALPRVP